MQINESGVKKVSYATFNKMLEMSDIDFQWDKITFHPSAVRIMGHGDRIPNLTVTIRELPQGLKQFKAYFETSDSQYTMNRTVKSNVYGILQICLIWVFDLLDGSSLVIGKNYPQIESLF